MDMIRKHKKEILISLLTGIFLFYVQPILSYFGDVLINGVLLISDTFSVMYYKAVAKNDPNAYGEWTNFLQIYFLAFLMLYFVQSIRDKKRDYKRKIESNLRRVGLNREKLKRASETRTQEEIEKEKEELTKEMDVLEADIIALKDRVEKRDTKLMMGYILSAFVVVLLFSNYAMTKSVINENTNFRNELIKLEPFANETELKILRADWVEMKSKTDYNRVIEKLNSLQKGVVKK